jgi:NADH dehydrogenase (ubiquinone) Fe-S protein 1
MNFEITIDKNKIFVNTNMSILQACDSASIAIPRFCYHEKLSIGGNCRMCLVEVKNAPKLVASCAVNVIENMVVFSDSLAVKKSREGVLEFLLLNHPLDCAICDQAGECDLQDQSLFFGSDRGRFQEHKRAVEDLISGPLVKSIMSRCIHCTRCVRFANEIMGIPELGTSGRGNRLAINLYINKLFKSEFSGNLIDLCPVGALTAKPYVFTARPWELKSIESLDIFDGVGSNIRIDIRGYEIMRVLPRLNELINEDWISDKTRFAFDGLKTQRLYEPLFKKQSGFIIISWEIALKEIVSRLSFLTKPYTFGVDIGPQADFESMFFFKIFG